MTATLRLAGRRLPPGRLVQGFGGGYLLPIMPTMGPRDIYDDMPDGAVQRDRNKQRLAELEADGAARRARIAEVVAYAELAGQAVLPACSHSL
jgi:hypothetical protein